ncbi:MAG: nuclear transport factor 2 family protein [Gemmatimonadaceae bacterium]|nr:nuclear transport factor 2 family protein [Gemmatimonadaceae bacterium]
MVRTLAGSALESNAELIRSFYSAFQRRDHEAMFACYAPGATFRDPVFGDLAGWKIAAMWRMLCERATDLDVRASGIAAGPEGGTARWDATYTFAGTGRRVHNVIDASFTFFDGRISTHIDSFDLYRWSRQALGLKGVLLGWTPMVQNAIRTQASSGLEAFIRKKGLGPAK